MPRCSKSMWPANFSVESPFNRCNWSTTNVVSAVHIRSSLPMIGSPRLPFAFST